MRSIESIRERNAWLAAGAPARAAMLALDLSGRAPACERVSVAGRVFLGCTPDDALVLQLHRQRGRVVEELDVLPAALRSFSAGIYTVPALDEGLAEDPEAERASASHSRARARGGGAGRAGSAPSCQHEVLLSRALPPLALGQGFTTARPAKEARGEAARRGPPSLPTGSSRCPAGLRAATERGRRLGN